MKATHWREFGRDFRNLVDPENALHAFQRNRNQWDLAGGPTDDAMRKRLHDRFDEIATRAGMAAGVPARSFTRDGWLSLIREDSPHCTRYTKGSIIRNLRWASVEFSNKLTGLASLLQEGTSGAHVSIRRERYPLRSWLYDHVHHSLSDCDAELDY